MASIQHDAVQSNIETPKNQRHANFIGHPFPDQK